MAAGKLRGNRIYERAGVPAYGGSESINYFDKLDIITDLNENNGTNLALSATASAFNNNNDAYKVNDDNLSTEWTGTSSTDEWIQLDFGTVENINKFLVEQGSSSSINRYVIQYWDSVNSIWKDAFNGTVLGATKHMPVIPISTQKVRLYIKSTVSGSPSIKEFKAFIVTYEIPTPTPTPIPISGSDEFNSSTLKGKWSWVREDNTHWKVAGSPVGMPESIRITSQGGDLCAATNNARNLLLQTAPAGDFTVITKATFSSKPSQDNQQAGLVIYQDDDNYIKLVRAYANGNEFQFAKEIEGLYTNMATPSDSDASMTVYLKLVKSGNDYSAYYSYDGRIYTQAGTTQTVNLSNTKIGLASFNSSGNVSELNVDFDWFNYSGKDEFSSSTLGAQWYFVRPDATHWSLTADPGSMRITSQGGDLYLGNNNARNVLLQTAPIGDFTVTTKATFSSKPSENNQQAGLVIYQDDDNYIKLVRAYANGNEFQFFAKEIGGSYTNMATPSDSEASTTVYLKIIKNGNDYLAYYSYDGTTYTQAGTTQTVNLSNIKIGLVSFNSGGNASELNVDFDWFDSSEGVLPVPSDEFNSSSLGAQWSWVRQDSTHCSLMAAPGSMRITSQVGDIYSTSNSARNLLLQTAPAGDFTIVTKATFSSKPSQDYQQAGLIIYQDDDNYMKLVRVYGNGNKFEFAKDIVGSSYYVADSEDSDSSTTVYLKLVKNGNDYSAYYSYDGTTYSQVGTAQTTNLSNIKIGLVAFNSGDPAELNIDFDWFRYTGGDKFDSSALKSQWSWARDDNTHWSLTAASGNMRITSQGGDLYLTTNNARNVLLQTAPMENFTMITKAAFSSKPSQDNQQAGLVIYQDDDNYIKLVRAHDSGNVFQFAKEIGGTYTNMAAPSDSNASTTVYLKLVKSGNCYSAYYSYDGTTYTQAGTMQSVNLRNIKIGLVSFNSGGGVPELDVDFDYFHY